LIQKEIGKMYQETKNYLADNEGKTITISGKISNVVWQHAISPTKSHPYLSYFDLKDGYQIILYAKNQITCKERVEVTGEVVRVKVNNDAKSKAAGHVEYHIIADTWKCI
jgi:hypothetical protein